VSGSKPRSCGKTKSSTFCAAALGVAVLVLAACERSDAGSTAPAMEFVADSFDLGDIGWMSEQAEEMGVDLSVNGLRAIDRDVAFFFGGVRVPAGTIRSFLLRTSDGGTSWHEVMTPVLGSELMHVAFSDPQHGWALAQWAVEAAGTMVLFGSTDGGKTWRQLAEIPGAQVRAPPDGYPLGMTFTSALMGEIELSYSSEPAALDDTREEIVTLATQDGGVTWRMAGRETRKSSAAETPPVHHGRGFDSTDWTLDPHAAGDPIIVRRYDREQDAWQVSTLPSHFRYERGRVLPDR
jgi:hypothetical protein